MDVGRRRKGGNPLGLEKRLYPHHGQLWYRHRDGRPEALGKDVVKANAVAQVYNDPEGRHGTIGYFLDLYIAEAKARRLLKNKKPRTIKDYESQAPYLKEKLGKLLPTYLAEHQEEISNYRDARTAKVRGNRELSLLSAMYAWLLDKGLCPGLTRNPVDLVQRNPETPKARYVDDAEYRPVHSIAVRAVCMAMQLCYITLQRPGDVLRLGGAAVTTKTSGGTARRVLSVTQGKTGRTVNIELTDELEAALWMITRPGEELGKLQLTDKVTKIVPLVHKSDGSPYTEDGIHAMMRRYCIKAKVQVFGLMDLRAKGATDMYLRGVPLEKIQLLMGHKSVTTTEIYIKQLLATIQIAQPNSARGAA
jgi:integrase